MECALTSLFIGAPGDSDSGKDAGAAYVFLGLADCNDNDALDICDILELTSEDKNENGIPDECECPADLTGDGKIDIHDVFAVLAQWGTCDDCPEDLNDDGKVNIDDIFIILGAWGPCV